MEDETLSAEPGLETATPEVAEPQNLELEPQQIEGDAEETEGDELEAQPTDEDLEEFEWEGKQIKAPKGLKEGVLRQADYTRKTQEISQTKRELEERATRIDQQLQASEEELGHRAHLQHIKSELKRFEGFDWAQYQSLKQTDPAQAEEAWQYVQYLKEQSSAVEQKISQAQQQRTQEAEQDFATRREQALEHARKNIKGWTPEVHQKVIDFAEKAEIPLPVVKQFWGPQFYEILHKAMIGDGILNKPAPKPNTPPVNPLETVGAKRNPPGKTDLSSADMDDYIAMRKRGVGGKAAFG